MITLQCNLIGLDSFTGSLNTNLHGLLFQNYKVLCVLD